MKPCGYCLYCSNKLTNNGYLGLFCDSQCADFSDDVEQDLESDGPANDPTI